MQAHDLSCAMEDLDQAESRASSFISALSSSIQTSLLRLHAIRNWKVGCCACTSDRSAEHRDKARSLAERALQLQPDLPEAHLALGFSYYYGDNDYDAALREFEITQRGLPNESEVYLAIGAIQRRQGKWAESTANLEKAASLNPKGHVAAAKSRFQLSDAAKFRRRE